MKVSMGSPPGQVFGPCPGCHNWQLEVPGSTPVEEIEGVVQSHADECWELRDLLGSWP